MTAIRCNCPIGEPRHFPSCPAFNQKANVRDRCDTPANREEAKGTRAAMIRAFVEDLVDSMRDTFAYVLFTLFAAWLYAPEDLCSR